MKRDRFDMLAVDKKVDYINKQLQSGMTMKQIAEQLNYNDSTLRKQINKAGYHIEDGVYTDVKTKVDSENNKEAAINIQTEMEKYKNADITEADLIDMVNNTPEKFVFTVAGKMALMSERLNEIEKRLKHTNVYTRDIAINIPDGDMKLVSFRLNETVYEQWKQFTNDQKVYRSQDLLAMALLEYIEKHK